MNTGTSGFYHPHASPHEHYASSGHCGLLSNVYGNNTSVNVNCEIPDQSVISPCPHSAGFVNEQQWLQNM